jgi:hypothetical protein
MMLKTSEPSNDRFKIKPERLENRIMKGMVTGSSSGNDKIAAFTHKRYELWEEQNCVCTIDKSPKQAEWKKKEG